MKEYNFCPSCGVQYFHHLGLIGTCAELQKAKLNILKLKEELYELQKKELIEIIDRLIEMMEKI